VTHQYGGRRAWGDGGDGGCDFARQRDGGVLLREQVQRHLRHDGVALHLAVGQVHGRVAVERRRPQHGGLAARHHRRVRLRQHTAMKKLRIVILRFGVIENGY
jgi:hypothetical protein